MSQQNSTQRTVGSQIAVIGGGVIGMMIARQLQQIGLQVCLLEKNPALALEASRAGGGIISPLHPWRYSDAMLDLAAWSHKVYPKIARQLSQTTGIYVPLNNTGMLVPDTAEAEAALACEFLASHLLSADQVANIEPGLAEPCESVWVPEVNSVRNPALCRALIRDLALRGVNVFTDTTIDQVQKLPSGFVLQTNRHRFEVEKVVVATGAWSSEVLRLFAANPPVVVPDVFPVKGQMLAFRARPGVLRSVVLNQHRYLIPRHDGVILAGSTVEDAGFDQRLTESAREDLYGFAVNTLPSLRFYPVISQWSGLRPGSHRDRPFIGELPGAEGVYASVGHFRNGLLSAPATAQLIEDLVMQRESQFDLSQYAL